MPTFELFRLRAQTQLQALTQGVRALERDPYAIEQLDACMCAARSVKDVANIVGMQAGVHLACAMEDCFAAARRGELEFLPEQLDLMLQGVDLLDCIVKLPSEANAAGTPAILVDRCDDPQRALASGPKRVLVVDDSLGARELSRRLLDFRGHEVQTAVDGLDAWRALRASRFDLVLTDIDMPLIDGVKLTQLIRADASLAALPVLVACDEDRQQDWERCFQAGADYYVVRGKFYETLLQTVANLIGAGP